MLLAADFVEIGSHLGHLAAEVRQIRAGSRRGPRPRRRRPRAWPGLNGSADGRMAGTASAMSEDSSPPATGAAPPA